MARITEANDVILSEIEAQMFMSLSSIALVVMRQYADQRAIIGEDEMIVMIHHDITDAVVRELTNFYCDGDAEAIGRLLDTDDNGRAEVLFAVIELHNSIMRAVRPGCGEVTETGQKFGGVEGGDGDVHGQGRV